MGDLTDLTALPIKYAQYTHCGAPPFDHPPWLRKQVHNLVDTISINHNWLSAPGLMSHVAFISRELARARGERGAQGGAEWEAECQRKLHAHAGTDVPGLVRMLDHFAQRALDALALVAAEGGAAGWGTQRLRARQRLSRYELRQITRAKKNACIWPSCSGSVAC